VLIVALEQAVAAPFASRQLADLGARVIKVERPGTGDFARSYDRYVKGQSSYFVWLNRGKESLTLDLKAPQDRAVLDQLIERADVFLHNLAPGAVTRLGLGAVDLRPRYPSLITCSISGYGSGGPYQDKKAYDLLVQCETGLLAVTGDPERPAKVGISVADIAAGMYAYSGILTALYNRERTDKGVDIEVSMLEALGEWMAQPTYIAEHFSTPPGRHGARHATIAPYGPYRTGDGSQVFLGIQNDREWGVFCDKVLGHPELAADPRFVHNPERLAHDDEITVLIERAFSSSSAEQVNAWLDEVEIANARLREPGQFAAHPQLAARDRWRWVQTPGGHVRALVPPVTVEGRQPVMGRVPALGQHNEAIRAELEAPVAAHPSRTSNDLRKKPSAMTD
jgi:itaconate CoA-transferase